LFQIASSFQEKADMNHRPSKASSPTEEAAVLLKLSLHRAGDGKWQLNRHNGDVAQLIIKGKNKLQESVWS
jgi:hypothetical protein